MRLHSLQIIILDKLIKTAIESVQIKKRVEIHSTGTNQSVHEVTVTLIIDSSIN